MLPEGQADHTLCSSRGSDKNRSAELHREGETEALNMLFLSLFPLSSSDSNSLNHLISIFNYSSIICVVILVSFLSFPLSPCIPSLLSSTS